MRSEKGFTLIELMVVMTIISILAGFFVIPGVLGASAKARVSAASTDIGVINKALDLFLADNEELPNRKDSTTKNYYTLLYTGMLPDDDLVMKDPQDTDKSQSGVLDTTDFPLNKRDNLYYHMGVNDRYYPAFKEHPGYGWRESYIMLKGTMRDPWDNSYVIVFKDQGNGTVRVFILSAGANKVLDTDPAVDTTVNGNDIGLTYILRP